MRTAAQSCAFGTHAMRQLAMLLVAMLLAVATGSVQCALQCQLGRLDGDATAHPCQEALDGSAAHEAAAPERQVALCKSALGCHLTLVAVICVAAALVVMYTRRHATAAPSARFTSLTHAPAQRPPISSDCLPAWGEQSTFSVRKSWEADT